MADPMPPPVPCDDARRLEALRRYGILDTPPEEAFDGIARLAAHVCRVPIAAINFIDEGRQWFKSEIGLGVRQTPLDVSICAHAILRPGLFVVPDATKDGRFACNPLVASDPHLRFYAGALLETADGHALGTLCVLDYVPRDLDEAQEDALLTLARQVMAQLELRRELAAQAGIQRELRRAGDAAERANRVLAESEGRHRAILDSVTDAFFALDRAWRFTYVNRRAEVLLGRSRGDLLGKCFWEEYPDTLGSDIERRYHRAMDGGEAVEFEEFYPPHDRWYENHLYPSEDGLSVYFRDITERRRAGATIAEQLRLAEFGRDVGLALTEGLTLDEMLGRCAEATVRHLDGAFARIWIPDESGEVLVLRASVGMYSHTDGPHARIPIGQYKIGLIAQERRPHLTNSVVGDPRIPAQDWARAEGMVAFAGYPLLVEDRLVGVLAMFARHALSEATLVAMESVAQGIALGVERKRAAEALAKSEAWLATTLASIGDAVIAADEHGHVRFLNPVAERLTGWGRAEAAGRPMEEVFRIVNEHTRRPAESPVGRVLREGVVVGLANHTVLISRDGAETPIEDSAAPIRDREGRLGGVVMVFRDVTQDRAARSELRSSEARKAAVLETALDAIVTMDHQGKIVEWNPAAERIFGHGRAEALGRGMADLVVPPSLREAHLRGLARYLETGEGPVLGRRFEITALRADGSEFPVELAIARIPFDGPPLFTAHVRDITEARRAESEQRRLTSIIERSPDFIGLADADQAVVFVNRAGRRLVGLDGPEEVRRTSILDYFPEAERGRVIREALPALLERGHWDGEVLFRHFGTGATIPMLWNVFTIPDPESGRPYFACVSRDITERKRAEEVIRERERQFHSLAESIPQLAWMAHPDGHIDWYNRRWYEYTGTTPEEMEGWGWQAVHDPEVLSEVLVRWRASIASGEPFDMTFPLRGGDGVLRPFLTRIMPVRDAQGRVFRWFGTNTDISERMRIEEELRAAKEEAEAANQAKTQFLAVLSHELRTPLNPILLAASSMLERPADPSELRPTLEMIRQNVNVQARLIDDLLDVMRIVRGKMPLHWEIADCHKLIDQAVQVCRSEVLGHHLRLEIEATARHRHVNADPARLQQVFWNLIKNAVKFTPEGGTVTVRTSNVADHGQLEGWVVVEVIDTGIGIEPEVLPVIFEPFQQGETTITRKFGGLGLGLAICKGVVDAHGGTIVAESAGMGRGTTFRVTLKALPAPADEVHGEHVDGTARAAAPSATLRILAVEDEPTTLRLMARLLRGLGHAVTTAGSVAEAVREYESSPFDLIVSDIGLPDATGLDLMRRVLALRGPVAAIALTGYGMEEDIRRSREAGFTAHLTKPIDFAKLEAMIRQVAN